MPKNLQTIENKLGRVLKPAAPDVYMVPSLWINPELSGGEASNVDPYEFFSNIIKRIYELSEDYPVKIPEQNWTHHAVVYNMFIRHTTAYDHNNDGRINTQPLGEGFRETGTFMKAIAMLPYIHSLGVNTIYLLPVTSIGVDGRKGNLGSPYAIKHHFRLDENLSEPFLRVGVETQFAAFVEAAHLLGIKIVVEFVFRTASIDSDLALEHPHWFYWIRSEIESRQKSSKSEDQYGAPVFTKEELKEIESHVQSRNFDNLPAPHRIYIDMFTHTPDRAFLANGKIKGITRENKEVKIPDAFADWPPNDVQPPWSDITYLKLYDDPNFYYIAYNTVRMYDNRLAQEKNKVRDLWESICNIIPFYQNKYKIDGVMIDMGHALPNDLRGELIRRAREINPNFVFWEENFSLTQESVEHGYNASLGYMWAVEHESKRFIELLQRYNKNDIPIPFFLTPETHNTHRTAERKGGIELNKLSWAINCFLPGILFIHAGFELGETMPVNTGLDFTPKEIKDLPPEKLPLFSEGMLNWNNANNITKFMRHIYQIRNSYIDPKETFKPDSVKLLETSDKDVIAFTRKTISTEGDILIIASMNPKSQEKVKVELPKKSALVRNLLDGYRHSVTKETFRLVLEPLQVFIGFVYYHD